MPGKIAQFDCDPAAAYCLKAIGPAAAYSVQWEVYLPSDSLDWALLGGVEASYDPFGQLVDGFFAYWDTVSWKWWSNYDVPVPTIDIIQDAWVTMDLTLTFTGGTAWDTTWKQNGVDLFGTFTSDDTVHDNTTPINLFVGSGSGIAFPNMPFFCRLVTASA